MHCFTHDNCLSVKPCMLSWLFFIQTLPRILRGFNFSIACLLDEPDSVQFHHDILLCLESDFILCPFHKELENWEQMLFSFGSSVWTILLLEDFNNTGSIYSGPGDLEESRFFGVSKTSSTVTKKKMRRCTLRSRCVR